MSKRSRGTFESESPPQHAPYALYGTPLPACDPEVRDDGSYVPIWRQEVTDERGRKRLHGAFTGGFSAGYFNTVGSKEGWTPSTFVSSRSKRVKDQEDAQKRPEDYMDEEDLAEQTVSQRLEVQDSFAGVGSAVGRGGGSGMFADLFRTSGDTMGVKLLQRMGWRIGQGIGPKIKRRIRGDEKGELHAFAPENSRMVGFTRKTDRKGLGFAGQRKLETEGQTAAAGDDEDDECDARILQNTRSKTTTKPKKLIKSGLGVGVLNDTGSDDDDAYAIGPQIRYNRTIGGDKKMKKKGKLAVSNSSVVVTKRLGASKQHMPQLATFRKCHDGRLPLDGFVLSLAPLSIGNNEYPAPIVPECWASSRLSQREGGDPTSIQSTADAAKASNLDAKARAVLLGEQALPGKSVFDFLSSSARDRLANASGKSNLPPARNEPAPSGFETSEADKRRTMWNLVPPLDKATAAAALQRGTTGWMPYAEDEDKRDRYRYFLSLRAGLQSDLPSRPKTFSVDEWSKELREFSQAAEVFKPISGLMATRFTTSTATPKLASDAPDSPPASLSKELDPAEKAAQLGMFGPLTRSRQPFYPTRLLCKRFNVKPPPNVTVDPGRHQEHGDGTSNTGEVVSKASLDRIMEAKFSNLQKDAFVLGGVEGGTEEASAPSSEVRTKLAAVNAETNDALEGQRAGDAVFKAIFGGDDEDD